MSSSWCGFSTSSYLIPPADRTRRGRCRYPARTWLCGRPGICCRTAGCSALRVPGSQAARAGKAAFRDELGTHARGAVLQESIFAGAGGSRVQGLVVLARNAQAFPLMPRTG